MADTNRSELSVGVKTFFAKKPKPFIKPTSKKVVIPTNHIVGRFQSLKDLTHPNLCKYIDVVKGKHERLFIVSEHYTKDLMADLTQRKNESRIYEERELQQIAFTLLKAFTYLNEHQIIHRNLSLDNIMLDEKGDIKLADYGLYSMTEAGSLVPFPIGNPTFLAPESIARGIAFITPTTVSDSFKVDTWSLGVLLMHLVLGHAPWDLIHVNTKNNASKNPAYETLLKILKFCGHDIDVALEVQKTADLQHSDLELIKQKESAIGALIFNSVHKNDKAKWSYEERQTIFATLDRNRSQILTEWLAKKPFDKFSNEFKEILLHCLTSDPIERPEPQELLQHPYFSALLDVENKKKRTFWAIKPFLKCSLIPDDDNFDSLTPYQRSILFETKEDSEANNSSDTEASSASENNQGFSVEDLFHFWFLTGGDIEAELLSPEYKIPPPVMRLPVFVQLRDETQSEATFMFQQPRDSSMLYWDKILAVSFATLRSKIESSSKLKQPDTNAMSLTEREKSWIYQQNRVSKLRGLIARPRSWRQALVEAEKDVPPVLRADLWALALGVTNPEEYKKKYDEIDKESEGIHDRQIDLDVPRCHQYNPALSSSAGHRKLKRILKAWVKFNPDYAYWQGVDSLLAPFVVLNFNDEARSFWCLQRVVDKFLHNVLLHKDEVNNSNLQERLVLFQQILAYHDPVLANHLNDIGFKPELYAIPWFLTLFTHIFSLDEIFHIWDTLLLSPPSFSLFIACAIMRQLKDYLLPLDFNACIHLFSSLPAVNIDECLKDAKEIMSVTPPSVTTLNENSKPSKRWWEQRIPLDTLATQLSPRIAVTDLVSAQFKFAVLDIRGPEESERVFWPDSLKFDPKKKQKSMPKLLQYLSSFKDHIVVVDRGNNNTEAIQVRISRKKVLDLTDDFGTKIQFANELVQANVSRVSVLNGGIEALVTDAKPLLVVKQS